MTRIEQDPRDTERDERDECGLCGGTGYVMCVACHDTGVNSGGYDCTECTEENSRCPDCNPNTIGHPDGFTR